MALSVEDQQVAAVDKPIDQGGGHRLVEEDGHSVAEFDVGRHDHAALLVAR